DASRSRSTTTSVRRRGFAWRSPPPPEGVTLRWRCWSCSWTNSAPTRARSSWPAACRRPRLPTPRCARVSRWRRRGSAGALGAALIDAAGRALAGGDVDAARRAFQSASELGAAPAELAERLESAAAEQRRRKEDGEATRIAERLSHAEPAQRMPALLEYLSAR